MLSKVVNVRNYMKVYYTNRITSICFGQSWGNTKGVHYKELIHWDFTELLNEWTYIKYCILKIIHDYNECYRLKYGKNICDWFWWETVKVFVVNQHLSQSVLMLPVWQTTLNNAPPEDDPGHAVAQLVEALRYKPECRAFDSRWCHWNFSLI